MGLTLLSMGAAVPELPVSMPVSGSAPGAAGEVCLGLLRLRSTSPSSSSCRSGDWGWALWCRCSKSLLVSMVEPSCTGNAGMGMQFRECAALLVVGAFPRRVWLAHDSMLL